MATQLTVMKIESLKHAHVAREVMIDELYQVETDRLNYLHDTLEDNIPERIAVAARVQAKHERIVRAALRTYDLLTWGRDLKGKGVL
jgi:hypothetical protein